MWQSADSTLTCCNNTQHSEGWWQWPLSKTRRLLRSSRLSFGRFLLNKTHWLRTKVKTGSRPTLVMRQRRGTASSSSYRRFWASRPRLSVPQWESFGWCCCWPVTQMEAARKANTASQQHGCTSGSKHKHCPVGLYGSPAAPQTTSAVADMKISGNVMGTARLWSSAETSNAVSKHWTATAEHQAHLSMEENKQADERTTNCSATSGLVSHLKSGICFGQHENGPLSQAWPHPLSSRTRLWCSCTEALLLWTQNKFSLFTSARFTVMTFWMDLKNRTNFSTQTTAGLTFQALLGPWGQIPWLELVMEELNDGEGKTLVVWHDDGSSDLCGHRGTETLQVTATGTGVVLVIIMLIQDMTFATQQLKWCHVLRPFHQWITGNPVSISL